MWLKFLFFSNKRRGGAGGMIFGIFVILLYYIIGIGGIGLKPSTDFSLKSLYIYSMSFEKLPYDSELKR